jgi:acyl carrier protein
MTPTEQKLRQFITDNFFFDESELLGDASLTRSGIIDSTGVMEILLFLEEQFGIKVPDDEITPENLDTIDHLVRYVDDARNRMSA